MAMRPLELGKSDPNTYYKATSLIANETYQPLIVWKVPRQVIWSLIKNPKVRMKIYKDASTELPANARLMISIKKPGQELYQEIGTVKLYSTYKALDLSQQLDADNDISVRFNLKAAGSFPEESYLAVLVQVPEDFTVDWSLSEIYIGEAGRNDLVEADI